MKQMTINGIPENTFKKTNLYRVSLVKDATIKYGDETVSSASIAARIFREAIKKKGQADREHFMVLLLSTKNHVIGLNIVHVGSLSDCSVNPRDVIKAAILGNAAAIVLGHNHPSGVLHPSQEDRTATQRIILAGALMGVVVHDHAIFDTENDNYLSLRETETVFFNEQFKKAELMIKKFTS